MEGGHEGGEREWKIMSEEEGEERGVSEVE